MGSNCVLHTPESSAQFTGVWKEKHNTPLFTCIYIDWFMSLHILHVKTYLYKVDKYMFIYEKSFAHILVLIGEHDQNFENHFFKYPREEEQEAGELRSSLWWRTKTRQNHGSQERLFLNKKGGSPLPSVSG